MNLHELLNCPSLLRSWLLDPSKLIEHENTDFAGFWVALAIAVAVFEMNREFSQSFRFLTSIEQLTGDAEEIPIGLRWQQEIDWRSIPSNKDLMPLCLRIGQIESECYVVRRTTSGIADHEIKKIWRTLGAQLCA